MITKIISRTDENVAEYAAELLIRSDIVAIPTETVYGLAGNAFDETAITKIFKAKGRPQDNPLIFHISNIEMLYDLTSNLPDIAVKLAEKFWAGPLTMVLPKSDKISNKANSGLETVAIRMPQSDIMRKIIDICRFPLVAPSANLSGSPSPTSAYHVFDDFNGTIPLIIDGGNTTVGIESTVITFEKNDIIILRPGAVTYDDLKKFANVRLSSGVTHELEINDKPMSPGMKYKHYSPKADVIVINAEKISDFNEYCQNNSDKDTVAIIYGKNPPDIRYITYGNTPKERAQRLFAALRECDEIGAKKVLVHAPKKNGIDFAVYNRLLRAAAFRVVDLDERSTIIGLTGMSGAGKTTACEVFKDCGFNIINCDDFTHDLIDKSKKLISELECRFPEKIIINGKLDRKKTAEIIFSDQNKKLQYENIIYPYISYKIVCELQKLIREKSSFILLDAPTLFESGEDAMCDYIVAVTAEQELLKSRIIKRDDITSEFAEKRLSSQMGREFYEKRANFCVDNNSDLNEFKKKIRTIAERFTLED